MPPKGTSTEQFSVGVEVFIPETSIEQLGFGPPIRFGTPIQRKILLASLCWNHVFHLTRPYSSSFLHNTTRFLKKKLLSRPRGLMAIFGSQIYYWLNKYNYQISSVPQGVLKLQESIIWFSRGLGGGMFL